MKNIERKFESVIIHAKRPAQSITSDKNRIEFYAIMEFFPSALQNLKKRQNLINEHFQ